ncbi:MFS general substrate transporter [Lentinula aciculospora]|uniref:MFS general substrate transporter n=1 Tax=Lentinula aciculospora TaxID=153920 RepID=A0A9W9DED7_9AGAR|nr:MFS general substrate transporter [Lentinula aciculospora]
MARVSLVLKKFPPSTTVMGLVKNYLQLVGVRVCLGVAEAGLFPGVAYYLSLWYPRNALQSRIGPFTGAATIAGAFSGLFAFAISFMSGTRGLLGWSWIFIIEGTITVSVGLVSFLVLVDFPVTAEFLTLEERAFTVWKKKFCSINKLRFGSISCQTYPLLVLKDCTTGFGEFSTAITIVLGLFAHYSDKLLPFIFATQIMRLTGFSINIADVSTGAKYFGTFLIVAGSYSGFPGVVAWNGSAHRYREFQRRNSVQYKPRSIVGHGVELMFVGIGLISLPITVFAYSRINKKREEFLHRVEQGLERRPSPKELRELGDRAPDFRLFDDSPVLRQRNYTNVFKLDEKDITGPPSSLSQSITASAMTVNTKASISKRDPNRETKRKPW